MAAASIIIPAHNESALIASCLRQIVDHSAADEWEVIVVCNACTDDTAEQARSVSGVLVIETQTPGKMPALDAGDAAATTFPRIYVDADARVTADSLRSLARILQPAGVVKVGSPRLCVDTSESSRFVAIYFSVWCRLRYASEAIGSGVYGVSEAARARFSTFPERGGDDQLIYRLFTIDERVVTDPSFTYVAPVTVTALLRSRARMIALNAELERTVDLPDAAGVGWKAQGLEKVALAGPRLALRTAVFMVMQVAIKVWGRRLAAADEIPWHQDRTLRDAATD